MSLKLSPDDRREFASKFETCSSFLIDKLGFAPERINQHVIERIAHSLSKTDVSTDEAEAAIIAAATVGETYFLRHRLHFEWLQRQFLPRWTKRRQARLRLRPLRVLSAGCASGEEAYTLAAVLRRHLDDKRMPFEIVAFDVNELFLERAHSATYGLWSLRGVQIDEERDWLDIDSGSVSVEPSVQSRVRFVRHNLLTPLHEQRELSQPFDLIFCRNVLIYFHGGAVQRAYHNLLEALGEGGALVVGPSDPAPPDSLPLIRRWENDVRFYEPVCDTSEEPASTDIVPSSPPAPQLPPRPEEEDDSTQPPTEPCRSDVVSTINACSVARRLSRLSSTELACDFLRHHLRDDPMDVEAHVLLAMYLGELDRCDEAFQWGRRAVFLAPDAPYVLFVLGDTCARCERHEGYRRYVDWARELLKERDDDDVLRFSNGCTADQLREVLHVHEK